MSIDAYDLHPVLVVAFVPAPRGRRTLGASNLVIAERCCRQPIRVPPMCTVGHRRCAAPIDMRELDGSGGLVVIPPLLGPPSGSLVGVAERERPRSRESWQRHAARKSNCGDEGGADALVVGLHCEPFPRLRNRAGRSVRDYLLPVLGIGQKPEVEEKVLPSVSWQLRGPASLDHASSESPRHGRGP